MSFTVFLIVLTAALAHAAYNALIKGRAVRSTVTEIDEAPVSSWDNLFAISCVSGVLGLIGMFVFGLPAPASWPYFLLSGVTQLLYMNMIARVYAAGDYATGYPLMRGMGAFFSSLAAVWLLGDPAPWQIIPCVLLICGGILLMAFTEVHDPKSFRRQALLAFATCLMLAALTMLDVTGARISGNPPSYACGVSVVLGAAIYAWRRYRGTVPLRTLKKRGNWLAGAFALGSNCAILWAVTKAPAAMVVALRESSILFSVLLSAFLLREHIKRMRWVAAGLIALGVLLLKLA